MFRNSIHMHLHGHFLIMIGYEANICRSFFALSFFTAIPIVLDSAIASGAWEGSSVARHRNYPIIDCFERRVVRVPSGQEVAERWMEGEIYNKLYKILEHKKIEIETLLIVKI